MKVSFIGAGNMGEAILSALLDKQICMTEDISASVATDKRREYLSVKYGITAVNDNLSVLDCADVIILAIKPQTVKEVLSELQGKINELSERSSRGMQVEQLEAERVALENEYRLLLDLYRELSQ